MIDGKLVVRRFVCYMEGFSRSIGTTKSNSMKINRINREMRCGCAAAIRVKRILDSSRWIVGPVNYYHNHPMVTPYKRRYLRTNRIITRRSRELFRSLEASNMPPSKQFQIAAMESSGYECMSFSQMDFNNMRIGDRSLVCNQDIDLVVE